MIKDYLFKAGICKLATSDLVSMRHALAKYADSYPSFAREREYKCLEELTEACENFDAEAFTAAISEFDSVTTLDPWKTAILARVKKGLQGDGEDEDGGDGLEGLK